MRPRRRSEDGEGVAEREDFDAFVAARWTSLLRTAYLLVGEHALAEDLAQTALTKSWFAWDRIHDDPQPYVRRVMVTTAVSWWRRRWRVEVPTEVLPEPGSPAAEPVVPARTCGQRSAACQRASVP